MLDVDPERADEPLEDATHVPILAVGHREVVREVSMLSRGRESDRKPRARERAQDRAGRQELLEVDDELVLSRPQLAGKPREVPKRAERPSGVQRQHLVEDGSGVGEGRVRRERQ
jgi:hypothetical protein